MSDRKWNDLREAKTKEVPVENRDREFNVKDPFGVKRVKTKTEAINWDTVRGVKPRSEPSPIKLGMDRKKSNSQNGLKAGREIDIGDNVNGRRTDVVEYEIDLRLENDDNDNADDDDDDDKPKVTNPSPDRKEPKKARARKTRPPKQELESSSSKNWIAFLVKLNIKHGQGRLEYFTVNINIY